MGTHDDTHGKEEEVVTLFAYINPVNHNNDDAGAERVRLHAVGRFEGEVEVIAHVAHPMDEVHSLTTVTVATHGHMAVYVFVTWRDENGGVIEEVASPALNAAAH
jgi:hypothetical protein